MVAILPAEISGHIVGMAVLLKRGYIVRVAIYSVRQGDVSTTGDVLLFKDGSLLRVEGSHGERGTPHYVIVGSPLTN
jgi:hypothetical protein